MKKLIALILAITMMATLSVTAFAAQEDHADVIGKYEDNSTTPDVMSTTVIWGAMEFTYTKSGQMNWNDAEHEYTDNTKTEWTATGNTVTVVNHSNVAVKVTFAFEANEDYDDIEGTFTNQTLELKSAVGVGIDADSLKELTGTTNLTLSGSLESGTAQGTTVGGITVTIQKNEN